MRGCRAVAAYCGDGDCQCSRCVDNDDCNSAGRDPGRGSRPACSTRLGRGRCCVRCKALCGERRQKNHGESKHTQDEHCRFPIGDRFHCPTPFSRQQLKKLVYSAVYFSFESYHIETTSFYTLRRENQPIFLTGAGVPAFIHDLPDAAGYDRERPDDLTRWLLLKSCLVFKGSSALVPHSSCLLLPSPFQ